MVIPIDKDYPINQIQFYDNNLRMAINAEDVQPTFKHPLHYYLVRKIAQGMLDNSPGTSLGEELFHYIKSLTNKYKDTSRTGYTEFDSFYRVWKRAFTTKHENKRYFTVTRVGGQLVLHKEKDSVEDNSYKDRRLEFLSNLFRNEGSKLDNSCFWLGNREAPPEILLTEKKETNYWQAYVDDLKYDITNGRDFLDFRSIDFFEVIDHQLFADRDDDLNNVRKMIDKGTKLFLILGESGIGKSSFLNAGLIPDLINDEFLPIYIRATNQDIIATMKSELLRICGSETIFANVASIQQLAMKLDTICSKRVVLIIDQFEQIFTQPKDTNQKAFVTNLYEWYDSNYKNLYIILSMRDSYMHRIRGWSQNHPFLPVVDIFPLKSEDAIKVVQHTLNSIEEERFQSSFIEHAVSSLLAQKSEHTTPGIQPIDIQIVFPELRENDVFTIDAYNRKYASIDHVLKHAFDKLLRGITALQKIMLMSLISQSRFGDDGKTATSLSLKEICERISRKHNLNDSFEEAISGQLRELENRRLIRIKSADGEFRYELRHEILIQVLRERYNIDETQKNVFTVNSNLEQLLKNMHEGAAYPEPAPDIVEKAFECIDFLKRISLDKWKCLLAGAVRYGCHVEKFAAEIKEDADVRDVALRVFHHQDAGVRNRVYKLLCAYPDKTLLVALRAIVKQKSETDEPNRLEIANLLCAIGKACQQEEVVAGSLAKMTTEEPSEKAQKEMIKYLREFPKGISELINVIEENNPLSIRAMALVGVADLSAGGKASRPGYRNLRTGLRRRIWKKERSIIWDRMKFDFVLGLIIVTASCAIVSGLGGFIASLFESSILWRIVFRDGFVKNLSIALQSLLGGLIWGQVFHLCISMLRVLIPDKKACVNIVGGLLSGLLSASIVQFTSTVSMPHGYVENVPYLVSLTCRVWFINGIAWGFGLGLGAVLAEKRGFGSCGRLISQSVTTLILLGVTMLYFFTLDEYPIRESIGNVILYTSAALGVSLGYYLTDKAKQSEMWKVIRDRSEETSTE
jgi:Novel STAND NTPase 1